MPDALGPEAVDRVPDGLRSGCLPGVRHAVQARSPGDLKASLNCARGTSSPPSRGSPARPAGGAAPAPRSRPASSGPPRPSMSVHQRSCTPCSASARPCSIPSNSASGATARMTCLIRVSRSSCSMVGCTEVLSGLLGAATACGRLACLGPPLGRPGAAGAGQKRPAGRCSLGRRLRELAGSSGPRTTWRHWDHSSETVRPAGRRAGRRRSTVRGVGRRRRSSWLRPSGPRRRTRGRARPPRSRAS
jgi:hypothetical protein